MCVCVCVCVCVCTLLCMQVCDAYMCVFILTNCLRHFLTPDELQEAKLKNRVPLINIETHAEYSDNQKRREID